MTVILSPHAEQLIRSLQARYPERSPEELIEEGLYTLAAPAESPRSLHALSQEEFKAWLAALAQYSEKIPSRPGETFSRDMIYQDHD